MIPPRSVRFALPTGRRVQVRADLSVRVMLRTGLVRQSDEMALLDALDDVLLDDRELGRRLQDALVLHALDSTDPRDLHGLSEPDFLELLRYAITRLTAQPDDDAEDIEGVEVDGDDADQAEPEAAPVEDDPAKSWDDAVAEASARPLPEPAGLKVPASAEILEKVAAADAAEKEAEATDGE